MKPDDRLPPHSDQTEFAALGCALLMDKEAAREIARAPSEFFYVSNCRLVHAAIRKLVVAGQTPDIVTLSESLKADGKLEEMGGVQWLAALPDATPSAAQLPAYLKELESLSERRACIRDCQELMDAATAGGGNGAIGSASRRLLDIYAAKESGGLPEIMDAAQLVAMDIPTPPLLVHGLLHKGLKMAFGGSSKSFKTWSMMDLAISVASGAPWWGFETAPGRVLYANFEIPTPFFRQRLNMILQARNITLPANMLDHWGLRGRAVDIDRILGQLISRLRERNYSLVVIDPAYKLMGGRDENSAGDIGTLCNGFERIAVECGAAVAFGSHFSKGNQSQKEAIDRISGSGVYARDPDVICTLTAHEEEKAYAVEFTLRNLPPVDPFVVRWETPLLVRCDLDPIKLKQTGGRKRVHHVEDIITLLPKTGLTFGKWFEAASEASIPKTTFNELRRLAIEDNLVQKDPISGKWIPLKKP